jgi:hypothetical protein
VRWAVTVQGLYQKWFANMHQSTIKSFVQMSQGEKRQLEDDEQEVFSTAFKKVCQEEKEDCGKIELPHLGEELDIRFTQMINTMTTHISTLTANMENSLFEKMKNTMKDIIKDEVANTMEKIKEDMKAENEALKARLTAIEENRQQLAENVTRNDSGFDNILYISGIPVSDHENVLNKAKAVIAEGCKVKEAKVIKAERKKGYKGKSGVVVVTLETKDQTELVMKGCPNLKSSRNHKMVFISKHLDKETRAMKANLRSVLKACGKEKDFLFKGSFLVRKDQLQEDQRGELQRDQQREQRR